MHNGILFVCSFLLISFLMSLVWFMQLKNKNAGVVDVVWAISFMASSILFVALTDGYSARRSIVVCLVSLWCLRLGYHLFTRNWGKAEDARYAAMRLEWGTKANPKLFLFFQFQALASAFLSFPLLLIVQQTAVEFSLLELTGYALFMIGIVGEASADEQLRRFKQKPSSDRVCQYGLWNYSRHPNYFFEWLIWLSVFMIALPAPYGWIAFYCPVLMWHFLNHVTGVKITELHMIETRGEAYLKYQRTTSAFIPWFKLKR